MFVFFSQMLAVCKLAVLRATTCGTMCGAATACLIPVCSSATQRHIYAYMHAHITFTTRLTQVALESRIRRAEEISTAFAEFKRQVCGGFALQTSSHSRIGFQQKSTVGILPRSRRCRACSPCVVV